MAGISSRPPSGVRPDPPFFQGLLFSLRTQALLEAGVASPLDFPLAFRPGGMPLEFAFHIAQIDEMSFCLLRPSLQWRERRVILAFLKVHPSFLGERGGDSVAPFVVGIAGMARRIPELDSGPQQAVQLLPKILVGYGFLVLR